MKNVYGERFNKPFHFKYDGEEYTVPLAGEVNEITGEVSNGNDLWPVELAEHGARYMVERLIIEDEKYWYEMTKPRGQVVLVKGGIKLQDEELKLELLETILGPKPSADGKQKLSTKEQMIQNMKLAKESEEKEFEGLETDDEVYTKIEESMSWNDIQKAAKDLGLPVTNKEDTINALVDNGFKPE